jgi:hypothetical protein
VLPRVIRHVKADQDIFIAVHAMRAGRAEEFARLVLEIRDLAADRRVLHVDVDDGKKDGNAFALAPHDFRFSRLIDDVDLAVGRRNNGVGNTRRGWIRVAKEIEGEYSEEYPQSDEKGGGGRDDG